MKKSFKKFLAFFGERKIAVEGTENVATFIEAFSGKKFGNGAFRVLKREDLQKWHNVVLELFPNLWTDFKLFGFDWLGRFYATDEKENIIFVFDPATNEVMDLLCGFSFFVNEILPKSAKDILALKLYKNYLKSNREPVYSSCVGYKIPLYLGGEDTLENLEIIDLEVYWSISA